MIMAPRKILTDLASSLAMTLLPVAIIAAGLMVAATIRHATIGDAIAALRGQTMIVRPETRSFGVVRPGQTVTVEYSLTNLSSRPTRLLGSRTTCACTVPDRLPRTLNPGETQVVRVTLNTPDRGPTKPEEAQIRQEVLVYTSDPSRPQITLTLVGEVR